MHGWCLAWECSGKKDRASGECGGEGSRTRGIAVRREGRIQAVPKEPPRRICWLVRDDGEGKQAKAASGEDAGSQV